MKDVFPSIWAGIGQNTKEVLDFIYANVFGNVIRELAFINFLMGS